MWEWIFGLGARVLGLGIGYAAWRDKTRNRARDAETDAATRRQYEDPPR